MKTITKLKAALGAGLFAFVAILWAFGGLIGAVIAAVNDSLICVVLSIFLPGFGALYTVFSIFRGIF